MDLTLVIFDEYDIEGCSHDSIEFEEKAIPAGMTIFEKRDYGIWQSRINRIWWLDKVRRSRTLTP